MKHLALSLIVLATASTADAKPKPKQTVKAHMDRAAKAHKQGKYEVALGELEAAYAIDPQPKLLYAIAQVHAKLDNCTAAIDFYEKFLAAEKDKSKQVVVKQAIDACKKRLAEKAESERSEPPPTPVEAAVEAAPAQPPVEPVDEKPVEQMPAEPPPAAAPPPPVAATPDEPAPAVTARTAHSPWYSDVIGDVLVIGGIGATVGSLVMYRGARSDLDSAEAAQSLDDYNTHRDGAERKQLYTFALAGAGVALVAAGVLRFALRDSRRETPSVAIVPSGDGGLVTWSGGF